ncbi:MAG: class I SAM-dependent methyltransferase [Solirubrobacterales bacterium]|nr:class I SAM-dependent methyltransferase [Solirubrobacterales bacterium]
MEAFYAFAQLDYELLAGVADWGSALARARAPRADAEPLRLLDVACGSGRFPSTLLERADLSPLDGPGVAYDLLDPSPFSLAEAAGHLRAPFQPAARLETTLEDLDPAAGPWDVMWATHALYALSPDALAAAAERFVSGLAPHGLGFLAQGAQDGHYLTVYRAFLEGMRGAAGTPYLSGETVASALRAMAEPLGWTASEQMLEYEHVVRYDEPGLLEGYLRRCLFDDGPTLEEMLGAPVLGPYLAECRDDDAGAYRFPQAVVCLGLTPEGEAFPWTAGS